MKKLLLSFGLLSAMAMNAQTCSDLFISEYLEGNGNNKAIEFFNPTAAPIDLGSYRLIRWDNGSTIADQNPEGVLDLPLGIMIQPYSTYVIALNLTDAAGTGQNAPIDPILDLKADTLLCPGCATGTGLPRVLCFNGDDAISLQKYNGAAFVNIDIIGSIGERPTNSQGTTSPTAGWSDVAPYSSLPVGYTSAVSGPYFKRNWTLDHDLVRKLTIQTGVSVNPPAQTFNPSVQWDSLPAINYDNLGWHVCDCNPNYLGLNNTKATAKTSVAPNPSKGMFVVNASEKLSSIRVLNTVGTLVKIVNVTSTTDKMNVDLSSLAKGVYLLEIRTINGAVNQNKIIIE